MPGGRPLEAERVLLDPLLVRVLFHGRQGPCSGRFHKHPERHGGGSTRPRIGWALWMKLRQKAEASAASGAIDRTACVGTHARTGRRAHPGARGTGTNAWRYTHTRGACTRSGGSHGRTTHATNGNTSGCAIRRCQGRRCQQQPPCRRDHCLENGDSMCHGIAWISHSILKTVQSG